MHHRKVWRKCLRLQWLKNCTARAAVWFDLLTRFAFDPAKPRTPILWLCHPLLSRDLPSPLNRKSCSIAYTTCNTGPFSTPFKSAFSTAAARCLSLLGSTSRLVLSERERYSMARAETPPTTQRPRMVALVLLFQYQAGFLYYFYDLCAALILFALFLDTAFKVKIC